ncbi:mitochondrial uncoupling protein 1 [Panicum miliaceum]|uniref:Mitochondrial uncoupling protein 1 n=1 Tax=Panicum miliaceum TaxID=4540 RepID=A0A3L6Q1C9_PANMI|nr:mitochondrial uncoupling protein 1 [Panicum miliaceum]
MATDSSFSAVFFSSAFAACFAEVCTIPLDTAKVRLQLQRKTPSLPAPLASATVGGGTLATILCIAREEGVAALWKGIIPGLHRQFLYGGLRIGLYEPVCTSPHSCPSFLLQFKGTSSQQQSKTSLSSLAGVIAIVVANPTDLVKVRLQADGKANTVKRNYSGALNAYATIIRQEGIGALWTGLGPNVARNAIINAAELASYDQFKQMFLKLPGFTDNIFTHLLAGLGAGFFAVCIGSPVDVVKSRMMGDSTYRSTLDCFAKTLKNDGPGAFYKGFIANFCRIGSWNVIMFLTLEQID